MIHVLCQLLVKSIRRLQRYRRKSINIGNRIDLAGVTFVLQKHERLLKCTLLLDPILIFSPEINVHLVSGSRLVMSTLLPKLGLYDWHDFAISLEKLGAPPSHQSFGSQKQRKITIFSLVLYWIAMRATGFSQLLSGQQNIKKERNFPLYKRLGSCPS